MQEALTYSCIFFFFFFENEDFERERWKKHMKRQKKKKWTKKYFSIVVCSGRKTETKGRRNLSREMGTKKKKLLLNSKSGLWKKNGTLSQNACHNYKFVRKKWWHRSASCKNTWGKNETRIDSTHTWRRKMNKSTLVRIIKTEKKKNGKKALV